LFLLYPELLRGKSNWKKDEILNYLVECNAEKREKRHCEDNDLHLKSEEFAVLVINLVLYTGNSK
jgi:hypothetical protein